MSPHEERIALAMVTLIEELTAVGHELSVHVGRPDLAAMLERAALPLATAIDASLSEGETS